jgi:WD40 repeat protein
VCASVRLSAASGFACACAQFGGGEPCLERSFRGHRGGVSSLVFNPNMRQLISGGLDGDVLVWNFKPSLRAYRFAGHTARELRAR